jgi:lipid-A-disaccharide synthase-like uncharacterized protein
MTLSGEGIILMYLKDSADALFIEIQIKGFFISLNCLQHLSRVYLSEL